MITKKILLCIIVLFASIPPISYAYQEMEEPPIIFFSLPSGVNCQTNKIGMYSSAADSIIKIMGSNCFKKENKESYASKKLEESERYELSVTADCYYSNSLFYEILNLYEDALSKPQQDSAGSMVVIRRYKAIAKGDKKVLMSLSVKVDKDKKIITESFIDELLISKRGS